MAKKYLTRPYLDIKTGTVPDSEYKAGKAVALLFVLDYLIHQAEGTAVKILDKTEKYLQEAKGAWTNPNDWGYVQRKKFN